VFKNKSALQTKRGDELKDITIEIKNIWLYTLLVILGVVFFLYLQVTLKSPIVFGDEGYHTRMAQWVAENKEYPVWIPFQASLLGAMGLTRPPLFALLEAGLLTIFNSVVILEILTPLLAVMTGLSTYFLVGKIYNKRAAFFASIILVTIPSFVTYSVILYTDMLLTFFFSLFVFTFIIGISQDNRKYLLLSGIFGAFAVLTKIVGYSAFLLIVSAFIYQLYKKKDLKIIRKYLYVGIPLILILSPYYVRNLAHYHTPDCFIPVFFDRSGCNKILGELETKYEFSGRTEAVGSEMDIFKMGIINYLKFAYDGYLKFSSGLNIPFLIPVFFAGLFLLFFKRTERNVLLALSLFSIWLLLTRSISGRAEDTARFMLGWAPMITTVCGLYLDILCVATKKYQNYFSVLIIILVLYIGYPQLTAKLNVMKSVKSFSGQFFIACDWIKENIPEDAIISTVWTHRTTYNAQRNVVGMDADMALSRDVNYTVSFAKKIGITHIFIQKFSMHSDSSLQEKHGVDFVQFLEDNPDYFKKVYENGPELQQCIQQGGCDGNILYEVVY